MIHKYDDHSLDIEFRTIHEKLDELENKRDRAATINYQEEYEKLWNSMDVDSEKYERLYTVEKCLHSMTKTKLSEAHGEIQELKLRVCGYNNSPIVTSTNCNNSDYDDCWLSVAIVLSITTFIVGIVIGYLI